MSLIRLARRLAPAALVLVVASCAAAAPQAKPAAPKAAPATAAAPPKSADPRTDALIAWISGFFPWGEGEVAIDELPQARVTGWRLVRAQKTYKHDPRMNDQLYAALDDGGKTAIVGDLLVEEGRITKPQHVTSNADLEPFAEKMRSYLRGKSPLVLDPANDRKGWKAVKIRPDTGYGAYEIGAYVPEESGALLVLGRAWERSKSVAEQRKAYLAARTAAAPAQGPADARVTVVEFSDMQCGFCKKRTADWEPLAEKLASDLRIRRAFKAFPLTNEHPWALRAASAARCFFEKEPTLFLLWKSNVYSRQETLSVAGLDTFAMDFAVANNVTEEQLRSCYLQPKSVSSVLDDLTDGFAMRVRSTPTYFVDGVQISWFSDNLMEEFLRKTYLGGKGLPLPAAKSGADAAKH